MIFFYVTSAEIVYILMLETCVVVVEAKLIR